MDKPEYFEFADGYAVYRPTGQVSLQQGINIVSMAISYAREQRIKHLLINVDGLTGFDPPNTLERFALGGQFARAAQGAVKVAFVVRVELVDPKKFDLLVARNRGLIAEAFRTDAEAIEWLLGAS